MNLQPLADAIGRYSDRVKTLLHGTRGEANFGLFIDNNLGKFTFSSEPMVNQTLVVDNTTDLNACKATAATNQYVFDNWQRISRGNLTNNNPTLVEAGYSDNAIPAESAAWTYNSGTDTMGNPLDTTSMVGFISPTTVENYVYEVVLKSTSTLQNDPMGILIGYARDADGTTHTLTVFRCLYAFGITGMLHAMNVVVDVNTIGGTAIANKDTGLLWVDGNPATGPSPNVPTPWNISPWASNPNGVKLKVTRTGDQFLIETSNYNGTSYVPAANLSFNLNDHPSLARFKGPQPYGYVAISQDNANWQVLQSPVPDQAVVDVSTQLVHTYSGGVWSSSGATYAQYIKPGRVYYNNITKKVVHLDLLNTARRMRWTRPVTPGPTTLTAGAPIAGFFGETPTAQLITGDALATLIGLGVGTSVNSTEPWLKFSHLGKTLFIAKKPFRHTVSWDQLNAGSVNAVLGARLIEIGGLVYKIRLIRGQNPLGGPNNDSGQDPVDGRNCEWTQLLYHVHNGVGATLTSEGISAGDWASYSDADLWFVNTNGPGRLTLCLETYGAFNSGNCVSRGNLGISEYSLSPKNLAISGYGWRPVLELAETY